MLICPHLNGGKPTKNSTAFFDFLGARQQYYQDVYSRFPGYMVASYNRGYDTPTACFGRDSFLFHFIFKIQSETVFVSLRISDSM
jgi:hypothetical protein